MVIPFLLYLRHFWALSQAILPRPSVLLYATPLQWKRTGGLWLGDKAEYSNPLTISSITFFGCSLLLGILVEFPPGCVIRASTLSMANSQAANYTWLRNGGDPCLEDFWQQTYKEICRPGRWCGGQSYKVGWVPVLPACRAATAGLGPPSWKGLQYPGWCMSSSGCKR